MIITLLDDYQLPPGRCYLCKSCRRHPGERIVDTGAMVDADVTSDPNSPGFQVLYRQEPLVFCEACIQELGHAVGMCTAGEADAARDGAVEASAERDRALDENTNLRAALDALRRAGYSDDVAEPVLEPDVDDAPPDGTPQLEFECEHCGRYFSTVQGLNSHGRAHKEHPVDA